jgi:hypothetical protein
MSLYDYLKRALGIADDPPPAPAMAQITIISTEPAKSSSGTRSARA